MQRVLVTAGANGIGRCIAAAFAAGGAKVAICDINQGAIDQLHASAPEIEAICADVGDEEAVARTAHWAIDSLGGIDVLVNNAGVPGPTGPIEDLSPADWRRCLEVNLTGPFLFLRALASHMKARRSGCVINVSTVSVRQAIPNRAPYVASKAGLEGLTRAVARELGPFNIRCNAVLPGLVGNGRSDEIIARLATARGETSETIEADILRFISLGRKVSMEEVAAVCLFLASDAAAAITGQLIPVDGNVEWEG